MIGEELPVEREEDNQHDEHDVAVMKNSNGTIVGHVPHSISASFEDFSAHSTALSL